MDHCLSAWQTERPNMPRKALERHPSSGKRLTPSEIQSYVKKIIQREQTQSSAEIDHTQLLKQTQNLSSLEVE